MLSLIQSHLQAIYQTQAPDIAPFLLDQDALRALMGPRLRPTDEWVLVREDPEGLDLGVYIDPQRLDELREAGTPRAAVERCFTAYCAATEGVSHFLMLIERARRGEPVRLLELEVQAEVDKFVTAWLHHRGQARRIWWQLFEGSRLHTTLSPEERWRYREAGRLAAGVCQWLIDRPDVRAVLQRARRFWRAAGGERLALARGLA